MSILHALHRATQTGEELFAGKLPEDSDMTVRQMVLLDAIKDQAGASQTELTQSTGIDRSTIAEMIRRLMRKGWATRARCKTDSRAYELQITQAGRAALKEALSASKRAEAELVAKIPAVRHLA